MQILWLEVKDMKKKIGQWRKGRLEKREIGYTVEEEGTKKIDRRKRMDTA